MNQIRISLSLSLLCARLVGLPIAGLKRMQSSLSLSFFKIHKKIETLSHVLLLIERTAVVVGVRAYPLESISHSTRNRTNEQ